MVEYHRERLMSTVGPGTALSELSKGLARQSIELMDRNDELNKKIGELKSDIENLTKQRDMAMDNLTQIGAHRDQLVRKVKEQQLELRDQRDRNDHMEERLRAVQSVIDNIHLQSRDPLELTPSYTRGMRQCLDWFIKVGFGPTSNEETNEELAEWLADRLAHAIWAPGTEGDREKYELIVKHLRGD